MRANQEGSIVRRPQRESNLDAAGPHFLYLLGLAVLLQFVFTEPAAAYIDPITGSIIFQLVAAVVLGAALTVRRVWLAVTGSFGKARMLIAGLWKR
jgi:hypothetical protein